MTPRSLKALLVTALSAAALFWGGSIAQAYLSPDYNNPALAPGGATPFVVGPGAAPDYLTSPNWAYTPPIRKFVDRLAGLGAGNANNLGQFLPVGTPDITTYPGSDYYVIELVQFTEKMHSDLPATTLRGYRQLNPGTDTSVCGGAGQPACTTANNTVTPPTTPHFLGPIIVSQKDRPVRVKFINSLPTGSGGDLFVPVDTSIMGAGDFDINYDPVTKEATGRTAGSFTQNRGELHLHGGRTPWISDGTPHQWITPAGEVTDYPTGVSVENVPDMPDPGPGAQTYYWTNQQSSRMMFYHDHAWGITRLNVYVGEAAGFLIRDETERKLIEAELIPGKNPGEEIPLVIMDKSFVDGDPNSPTYVRNTDPTWRWGTGNVTGTISEGGKTVNVHQPKTGDLWWPHVYMPAQNPFDFTGIAPMGRWAYGPYFWPATNNPYQPVANPYYSPLCDPDTATDNTPGFLGGFCQPPEVPSTPNPSWGAEAFMDTPMVNGTVYPVLEVEPKSYRLRILNAAHDRFWNLSMFVADSNPPNPVTTPEFPPVLGNYTASGYGGFAGALAPNTEVKMLPAVDYSADPTWPDTWPADGRPGGIPDWTMAGPEWVMIGSEGGLLPQPVVIPAQPVNWNVDVTTFNAGNVNAGSLILGPAERADVVVDFSAYAGQTLILYNDAPAPWPALDPHYDYYTDAPDNREMGGYDTTPIGFGPNTRTIMQIKVGGGTPGAAFNVQALKNAFNPDSETNPNALFPTGAFRDGQDQLIVGQGNMNPTGDPAYYEAFPFNLDYNVLNRIYERTFPRTFPNWGVSRINDKQINIMDPMTGALSTVTMKAKAIQDEQGETFDDYGRMRAALGLELTNPGAGQVNFIVQTYSDPSTEILAEGETQIWKITHNGVDTHPVHFHLYDVQVLNRVGWDGFMRLPDPTEMGWKDTVRISPLEDTIVALKPVTPRIPFGVPESIRPLNPARFIGDNHELSLVDPYTGEAWAEPNLNRMYNLDWEYVWHCHILSHEENDMMRPQSFLFQETLPAAPATPVATGTTNGITLTWLDPTPVNYVTQTNFGTKSNEIGFKVYRATPPVTESTVFTEIGRTLANATSYTDATAGLGSNFSYRVRAYNAAGDGPVSQTASATAPQVTLTSPANGASFTAPAQITLTADVGPTVTRVDFYNGATLLNSDTAAPFSFVWNNVTAGSKTLTARGFAGAAQFDSAPVTVTVVNPTPVTAVTFTNTPASPQPIGTIVNFAATPTGGGGSVEYQLWVYYFNAANPTWTLVRDWQQNANLSWDTSLVPGAGRYSIQVRARAVGSTSAFEARALDTNYNLTQSTPVSAVTFTNNPASPQPIGTIVNFAATPTGGGGTVEYQLWVYYFNAVNPTWTLVRDWQQNATLNWDTGLAPGAGRYSIQVRARTVGSTSAFEARVLYTNYNLFPD